MILTAFFKNLFGRTLKKMYEFILKNEYDLSDDTILEYEATNIEVPATNSITLTEAFAFSKLGIKTRKVLPNFLWSDLLNKLLSEVPNKDVIEQCEIFIGQVPDHRINASIEKISSTKFIILINSGLMLFLFRMARVFIATCRFSDTEFGVFEPEVSIGNAKELTKKNIQDIVAGTHNYPIQLSYPVTIKTSSFLTECLELFVIAHELGHLFHNLTSKNTDSITEEFSADKIGYDIYKAVYKSFVAEIPEHILQPLFYSAPHFLFYMFSSIEQECLSKNIKLADTHPPAASRSLGLRGLQSAYNDYNINEIDKHLSHFVNIF